MYDHYIALDWAKNNMAIARMTEKSSKVEAVETSSDISGLKEYLRSLKGKKIFTVEETSSSQWIYSELRPFVTKLIVCDPHRSKLCIKKLRTFGLQNISLKKMKAT